MGRLNNLLTKLTGGPHRLLSGIYPVSTGEPPIMGTEDLLSGYESMPWLQTVASLVGTKCAAERLELYAGTRNGKAFRSPTVQRGDCASRQKALAAMREAGSLQEITDHLLLDALEAPNPFMGRLDLLKITRIHIDLVGDAYWIKERNGLGAPVGFWPIPPHWISENPTPVRDTFRASYKTWQVELPVSDVVWFHQPQPANPYARGEEQERRHGGGL
jgi:Phage portal protein